MNTSNLVIEQQMYTRARRTMFLQSEGYGTVACSAGLSETFIKENVHPYCVYPTSPALQNYAVCPPAITVAHYPCGKMLLGQAVYVKADFTGQRSAFFAHNYILPLEMADDVLQDIGRVEDVRFLTDNSVGTDSACNLPTIAEKELFSVAKVGNLQSKFTLMQPGRSKSELLRDSNFELLSNATEAEQILPVSLIQHTARCVIASIYSAKKTYVIVPVPLADMHKYVLCFLTELYKHLPIETKHLLGFCTYAREPRNTKGLHLIFLENGTATARFSSDYVIDVNSHIDTGDTDRLITEQANIVIARNEAIQKTTRVGQPGGELFQYNSDTMIANADPANKIQLVSENHQLKYSTPYILPIRFFTESEFLHIRIPRHEALYTREAEWIDANLNKLSLSDLKRIPDTFIRRGKIHSGNAEIFVMLGILKACDDVMGTDTSAKDSDLNVKSTDISTSIRYLIGSYFLSEHAFLRIKKNICRLYGKICL